MPPSPPIPASPGDDRRIPATTSTSPDRPWPTVSVVLPTLNEEGNLPLVLQGLPTVDEVVVVDGGSTDDTVAVAREVRPDAVVVRQSRTGKGNALVCGFAMCTSDIVVTLNSDGSTDPGEIPRYVSALLAGAEVAHGSRYREGGGNLDEDRWGRLGNQCFNRLVNLLFGTRFTDLGYGYNAYWRALLPVLDLPAAEARAARRGGRFWGDGPEIEPLINLRMATQGLRVVEVASVGYPRIYGVRERNPVQDGARAAQTAAAEFLRRWRMGRQVARHPGVHAFREASGSRPRHSAVQSSLGPTALRRPAAPVGETGLGSDTALSYPGYSLPGSGTALGDGTVVGGGTTLGDPARGETTGRHAAGRARVAGAAPLRHVSDESDESDGDAARRAREQRWAQEQWTADQKSWRQAYTDPGAAAAGAPRPQAHRRAALDPHPEPVERPEATPRRPDLTVIAGERPWIADSPGSAGRPTRSTRLRALPGERYDRS